MSAAGLHIDRCVCHRVTFQALRALADERGLSSFEELYAAAEFGRTCTRCHPYVRAVLRDGRVVFDELLDQESGR